jgi:PAS domain S-box-containing protein
VALEASHALARGAAFRAYLDAALDCVILAEASGRVIEFNPAAERAFGYPRDQALGRTLADLIAPPSLRELHSRAFAHFVETRGDRLLARRLQLTAMRADGTEFPVELVLIQVSGEPVLICGVVRDLTDAKRAEADLRRLAAEQGALRRVATLVADEAPPDVIFASVAREIARILRADRCAMGRFEAGNFMTVVAYWSDEEAQVPVGTRIDLQGDDVTAAVRQMGRPILIEDHEAFSGPLIDYARALGALPRSTVAAPIFVEGRVWGSIFASTMTVEIPKGDESRVVDFTELLATAISNTEARRELAQVAAEQRALGTAATLIASGASTSEIFAAITSLASELFEVPFAGLVRYEPEEKATLVAGCAACGGYVGETWTIPEEDPGIVRTVVGSRQPARIDDHSGVHGPLGDAARSLGIGSVVGVPVLVADAVWGVLAVGAAQQGPPLPADASDRLTGFTNLVTTALINAETRANLRRLADEQAALRRVATLVAVGAEPTALFSAVSTEVTQLFDADWAAVGRYESDGSGAVLVGVSEDLPDLPVGTRSGLDEGIVAGEIYRTGRPARNDDVEAGRAIADAPRQFAALGFISTVGAPIVVEGELWGYVAASSSHSSLPRDTEKRIESFGEVIATAIANAESRAELASSEARARVLADEQAALRRVATLVAAGTEPDELFSAVSEEVATLFAVDGAGIGRFEADGSEVSVVGASESMGHIPVGTRQKLDESFISREVHRTGRTARVDFARDDTVDSSPYGQLAQRVLAMGFLSTVAAPVLVEGRLWGLVTASSSRATLPPNTERRVERFCELVATAIANAESRAELASSEARARALAHEQAALSRVATLVAQGASPDAVFSAVAREVAGIIDIPVVGVSRYESDGTFTILGVCGESGFTVGSRWPVDEQGVPGLVLATGQPSRWDDDSTTSDRRGAAFQDDPMASTLGVPIVVDGSIWGFLFAAADTGRPIPTDTEERLARFTQLVATAVSNATTRSELIASRARIVAAGDEARRRIERNLHDGTQQRLVSIGLDVETVRTGLPVDQSDTRSALERVRHDLEAVVEDVRELSHGLHPALLSQAGLGPSLRALARRSPIPVNLEVSVSERPSESIETAAYYVVSETLANATKHARASEVTVALTTYDGQIRAVIEDNGKGGAEVSAGSGLIGLIDRIEALGGKFSLDSPPGRGTRISVEMPMNPEPVGDVARVPSVTATTPASGPPPLPDLSYRVDAATLQSAVAASPDALYVVDPRGRIRFLNGAALRILGYDDERQLLGRPSHDTIHYLRPDGTPFPAAECPLLRPRLSGETVRVEDDRFVRQDGSLVAVAYSSAPVALEEGRGAVVSFRINSDRRDT